MRARELNIGGKKVVVPWNVADRLVDFLSPAHGDARYVSRARAAINGGYNSADYSRAANIHGHRRELDADAAILPDLDRLRADSQDLARNNPIASGVLDTNLIRVVGKGLFPKANIDRAALHLSDEQKEEIEAAAEREYLRVTETREFDAERTLPFSLLQGLAFISTLRDGDLLVNLSRFARPGSDALLKLQLIPAARISNPKWAADTDKMICGVEKDATGAPLKYWVSKVHPGSRNLFALRAKATADQWQGIDAFDDEGQPNALHLFDKKMPGQTRGVPYLAVVIEPLRQLARFSEAELMAAVVNGMLTLFVESQDGAIPAGPGRGSEVSNEDVAESLGMQEVKLNIGSIIGLPEGKRISVAESKRPSPNFDPFFLAIANQIGLGLGLPGQVVLKLYNSSYSAARAALEDAWCYFLTRRTWLVKMLCQPVYEQVIAEAVAYGRLSMPGFFSSPEIRAAWTGATWLGDAKPVIDETKAVKAAIDRIEAKISTIDEESRQLTGTPFEDKLPQILRERKLLRDAGLDPNAAFVGSSAEKKEENV
jgi:lambda family phage portal protein